MALPPHLRKLQEAHSGSDPTQARSPNKENAAPPLIRDHGNETIDGEHKFVSPDDAYGPNASSSKQSLDNTNGSRASSVAGTEQALKTRQLLHGGAVVPGDSRSRNGVSGGQRSAPTNSTPTEGMTVREAFGLKQQLDAANARYEDTRTQLRAANRRCDANEARIYDLEAELYVARNDTASMRFDANDTRLKELEAENVTLREASNARAGAYEARIRELEAENVALKAAAASSTVATSQSPQKARGRSSTRRTPNLTGYESSDDETSLVRGREIAIREPSAAVGTDLPAGQNLEIITKILEQYDVRINQIAAEQASARSAAQDVEQLGLNDRLKRLETLAADEDHDVNKAMQAWKVTVDADLERLSNASPPEAANGDLAVSSSFSIQSIRFHTDSSQKRLDEHLQRCELRDRQEARIDEAICKDVLHSYYQQLSTAIDNDESRAGSFEGGTDEFWKLRDRCVRRLATFDDCDEASNEAKKRWEYNGRRA